MPKFIKNMVLLYRINKYYKLYSVTSDDRYAYTQLSLSALNDRDTMMSLYEDIHVRIQRD